MGKMAIGRGKIEEPPAGLGKGLLN